MEVKSAEKIYHEKKKKKKKQDFLFVFLAPFIKTINLYSSPLFMVKTHSLPERIYF